MSKKKILKFLTKKVGPFSKLKKHVKKTDMDTLVQFKEKGNFLNKTKGHIAFGRHHSNSKLKKIMNVEVKPLFRNKGGGVKLANIAISKMKGKKVVGEIISPQQVQIRSKFQGTKFFEGDSGRKFPLSKSKALKFSKFTNVEAVTKVPKKGFKRHKNKTTGKIRFIRRGGRIIPIRSKK